ncbi:hypothetical protein GAYE_PCTG75G1594 [Galdieria yellowstonensis]|uniref:EKC/KEOPS complex subunit CGI121 n=1 Tax=Galdieria yellowstonensis TaxID=3028027 RepID=A0AAV9I8M7_9RHOD|nr:hypothetical protein GAYE_PCTG75G1594 [Galdieria yellowstonensis]
MPFTNDQVEILYFQDISNAHEIADCIHQRNLPAAVMDGATFLHVFQFGVAAQIALLHARRGKLVTHDVYSEIVFCLSARKNVREAFATFGFQSSSRNAVVVLVNPDADTKESVMKKIAAAKVLETNEDMAQFSDKEYLMQLYQVEPQELDQSNLLDSIVTRISTRVAL